MTNLMLPGESDEFQLLRTLELVHVSVPSEGVPTRRHAGTIIPFSSDLDRFQTPQVNRNHSVFPTLQQCSEVLTSRPDIW